MNVHEQWAKCAESAQAKRLVSEINVALSGSKFHGNRPVHGGTALVRFAMGPNLLESDPPYHRGMLFTLRSPAGTHSESLERVHLWRLVLEHERPETWRVEHLGPLSASGRLCFAGGANEGNFVLCVTTNADGLHVLPLPTAAETNAGAGMNVEVHLEMDDSGDVVRWRSHHVCWATGLKDRQPVAEAAGEQFRLIRQREKAPKILVVDDMGQTRDVVRDELLRQTGAVVEPLDPGSAPGEVAEHVLARVSEERFDFVVLDLCLGDSMPSGLDVFRHLQDHDARTTIIGTSIRELTQKQAKSAGSGKTLTGGSRPTDVDLFKQALTECGHEFIPKVDLDIRLVDVVRDRMEKDRGLPPRFVSAHQQ